MTLTFLKLGGSLITDKTTENTVRTEVLTRLAHEIAAWTRAHPEARLLLGHGSGSFGHMAAKKYGTRAGVHTPGDWRGYAEVSVAAARLNRITADALHAAGVPVISVLPSSSVVCADGEIERMAVEPIAAALARGVVPLVMGDVAIDRVRGGTIVSTEEVFAYLAGPLAAARVLLAGETEGVYERYVPEAPGPVIPLIRTADWEAVRGGLGGSRGADVTGGMASKVRDMLKLAGAHPGLEVRLFSGLSAGTLTRVLEGEAVGTAIRA